MKIPVFTISSMLLCSSFLSAQNKVDSVPSLEKTVQEAVDKSQEVSKPITLVDALEKAFTYHPQVKKVLASERVAKEDLAAAQAGLYPTLDFRGAVGREHNQTQSIENEGDYYRTLTRNEASLTLKQMLFDGFEVRNRIGKQRALLRRSTYNIDDNKQDLALRVIESYLEVLRIREQVAVAEENVAAHEAIRKTVESRVKRNLARESDAVQVRGRLSLAKAQLRREFASQEGIYERFREAVGHLPKELAKTLDRSALLPKSLTDAKRQLRQLHPALLASRETIRATSYAVDEAKARYYPRFDLEITGNEGDNISGSPSNEDHYSAMLVMNYNLFRGGGDRAVISSQRMLQVEQEEAEIELQLALVRDLSVSWHARAGLEVELIFFLEHMIATEKTLKAYETQYKMDQRTLFDLLNARSEHFRSRSTVIDTRYSKMLSVYQILVDMGVLMEDVFGKINK